MSLQSDRKESSTRPQTLAVGLVLLALLLVLVFLRQQPPAAKGPDAPPDQFSAGRALALLHELLPEVVPHPVGSTANETVVQRIIAAFEKLGYEVEIHDTVACRRESGAYDLCAPVRNIVTRLPGQQAGPALMVAAHHDSVRAGPGVADDASNVALILEIARILKEGGPHRNPIVFLVTDAEEYGLLGAQGFVDDHPWAQDVAVVLNLEARGTEGLSFMFETSVGNRWLVDAYASAVRRPASSSLHYEVYKILPRDTDLTVFREGGMAGLNWAFIGRESHYHTPLDDFEYLDLRSVQHQGEAVLAVARALSDADLANPPAGDAHWTDVMGLTTIHWPASWTLPLAIATVLLLLATAFVGIRRGQAGVGGVLLGLLAGLLCLLLPILVGLGLTWAIRQVAGVPSPWYAYPLPTRIALWAGALLCSGLVAAALGRRAGAWGLALGIWLLWAILALVLSLTLTGPAILFLLPAMVAGGLFALVAFTPLAGSAGIREAVLVVTALAPGALWLPFALAFESAVHFDLSPAVTLAVGLVVSALAPLMVLPRGQTRVRRWLLVVTSVVVLVATVVAMFVPPFTESDPQQVRLYYVEDRTGGTAHWAAYTDQGPLPGPLAGWFEAAPAAVFPWIGAPYLNGPAPAGTTVAPVLEVLSEEPSGAGRVVEARLRSPEGGTGMMLHVPAAALSQIEIEDYSYPVLPEDTGTGYYTLTCNGRGCDGLAVRLHLVGTEPIEVLVTDFDSGLPAAGQALLEARPPTAVPAHEGDLTIVYVRVDL